MRRALVGCLAIAALTAAPRAVRAQARGATALGDVLAGLGNTARVLLIAAHPDDEDTRLITWLTRGHHVDVAYLSLTRGDGGQNLIGNELGEALGVIRTEELLAARRIDGAHQYFTRAYDFGFSKTAAESFEHWPHDSLLKDVVTVIRAFKPLVVVAVFSGTPRDGHGQHQVSGILAREAYDVAGDAKRFPASATQGLPPWTPLKFYRTTTYWGGEGATFSYNSGEYNALLGVSYAEIAAMSRSQHKSQGFGMIQRKGAVQGSLRREASRVNEAADPSKETSIFDGIDTTWAGLVKREGGMAWPRDKLDSIGTLLARARQAFDPYAPDRTIAPLSATYAAAARLSSCVATDQELAEVASRRNAPTGSGSCTRVLPSDVALVLERLARESGQALLLASGTAVDAISDRELVSVADTAGAAVTVFRRGARTLDMNGPTAGGADVISARAESAVGALPQPDTSQAKHLVVKGVKVTQPWWLVTPRRGDLFTQPVSLTAEDRRPAPAEARFLEPETDVPIVDRRADPVRGEVNHPLAVAPAISVTLDRAVEYVPANSAIDRTVRVSLRSAWTSPLTARVSLSLPRGLTADSASRSVSLTGFGATADVDFRLRGKLPAGRHTLAASVESGGKTFATGYQLIEYDHIRPQRLYRDAAVTLQAVDVALPPGANIAYIPGVGDNVAPMLQELGLPVTVLDANKLAGADLTPYTAIVIGTRAYESQPALVANNARLLDWARNGGTLVVQYGQYEMTQPGIMPFPITLGRPASRVTDENAVVRVVSPGDRLLTTPNKIGDSDWSGWVQERSLYMPSTFDSHWKAFVSMNDPGEPANEGGILVAPYGRGTYVYTTLSLFRQLPAGVPGAARLFVNLVAARQPDAPVASP
ncbi:MAG TPA: PIG-L family deacetylase [Gemmatimonadaceae bacterium]|nr:PIG-L family deacetylase [Gemmatimonadaceae bacterium]